MSISSLIKQYPTKNFYGLQSAPKNYPVASNYTTVFALNTNVGYIESNSFTNLESMVHGYISNAIEKLKQCFRLKDTDRGLHMFISTFKHTYLEFLAKKLEPITEVTLVGLDKPIVGRYLDAPSMTSYSIETFFEQVCKDFEGYCNFGKGKENE